MKTIYIVSLGCPKNLTDTEKLLAAHFKDYLTVDSPEKADTILVNTCSFIVPAKEESIDTIFEFIELKKQYPDKRIVVTGCLWEQHPGELQKEFSEVEFLSNKNIFLASERLLTTYPFAYLKIAEGCSRSCSFCTIPLFKGKHKSRPIDEIVAEAKNLEGKIKELILVSQDTSFYGVDLYGKNRFSDLLDRLSDLNFPWVRVMYFYPQNLNDEILKIMASKKNICKYIDIPLQHLSNPVLKSMNRWGSYSEYRELISRIRGYLPESAVRTSFIVGYPGETDKDFENLLAGIEELKFDRAGFFTYSDEENTASSRLSDKISEEVKEFRYSRAVFIQEEISEEKLKQRVGKTYSVLIEAFDSKKKLFVGRSQLEAPEIDGIIYIRSKKNSLQPNNFVDLKITASDIHNLWGEEV